MLNRIFASVGDRRDTWSWLNLLIIFMVVTGSAYMAFRLSSMSILGSRQQSSLILMAFLLFVFAILSLRNMSIGLSALVFTSAAVTYSIDTGTQSKIVLAVVLVVTLSAVWLARMFIFERRIRIFPSNLNLPLFLFLAAALVSWIANLAVNNWNVILPRNILFVQAGQFAMFALSAAAFWLFANHPVSDRTLKSWTLAIILFGFFSFGWELFLRRHFYSESVLGAMQMWPVVLLASQLLFNPHLDRRLQVAGYAGLAMWAAWAYQWTFISKGSWMPAVFGIGILVFLKNARLGIVLGLLGGSYLLWSNFGASFFAGEEASLYRPYIWLDVIRMGLRSPLLGLGPVVYMYHWADPTFDSLTFQISQTYAWNRFNFSPPSHNLFVDIFAQTGIVGTVFFVWLLVAVAIFGWRMAKCYKPGFHRGYVSGVYAGFAAIAISSAPFADWLIPFVYNIGIEGFSHSVYSWMLLGTLVALDQRLKGCYEDA